MPDSNFSKLNIAYSPSQMMIDGKVKLHVYCRGENDLYGVSCNGGERPNYAVLDAHQKATFTVDHSTDSGDPKKAHCFYNDIKLFLLGDDYGDHPEVDANYCMSSIMYGFFGPTNQMNPDKHCIDGKVAVTSSDFSVDGRPEKLEHFDMPIGSQISVAGRLMFPPENMEKQSFEINITRIEDFEQKSPDEDITIWTSSQYNIHIIG